MIAQPISLLCPSPSLLLVQTLFIICAMVVLLVSDSHWHFLKFILHTSGVFWKHRCTATTWAPLDCLTQG